MLKGYYTLTSGMLTQQHRLDVISNNMTNVATPGYKKDKMVTTTFREELTARTGSMDKSNTVGLANTSMITVPDEVITNYEQGAFDQTGRVFDFAFAGDGFFEIQTPEGLAYSRNGSFTLDNEGYLYLQPIGRVMGENGPIQLGTDKFVADAQGRIILNDGAVVDTIKKVGFQDYNQLVKNGEGVFLNQNNANIVDAQGSELKWKTLERANVNAMTEMVDMMSSQKSIQSNSQILKMYDKLLQKIVTEIGRI